MPGHPKHTRLLPIRYHWRNDLLDIELPRQQPPFNETQGCSWLVQKTGLRGTLQPGERIPSLHSCFGRPRSFWEAGTIHFLQRTIVLRSLQGKMEASNTSSCCLAALLQAHCWWLQVGAQGEATCMFSSHPMTLQPWGGRAEAWDKEHQHTPCEWAVLCPGKHFWKHKPNNAFYG